MKRRGSEVGASCVPRRRWRVALLEVLLLATVLTSFTLLHAVVVTDIGVATSNALRLHRLETDLHLGVELEANRWLVSHGPMSVLAVLVYRLYYLVVLVTLVWVFVRRREAYPRVRRALTLMLVLALLTYWMFPVSPPRFALPGIVDVVAVHDIVSEESGGNQLLGANHTAMPSLHVGWAAWCAYAVWSAQRSSHPRFALVVWWFPLIMVAVVLATGQHYLADVVGSAAVLVVSITAAHEWSSIVSRRRG